jgi:bifunctional DNA-binding transcriptional regulator/antitoxin component of YhaV-PrlF toxin-antitoxin module
VTTKWTVTLEEDGEDLILPFPPDLLEQTGWKEGDTLLWDVKEDGSIILSKKEEV